MIRRAVEVAVAAVLVVACLSQVSCDRMRVSLGVVTPATLASAPQQAKPGSKRQVIRLAQPGFCSSVSSGDPALPCKRIYVALPPDADPASVRVIPGSYSTAAVAGCYDIEPVPVAATSSGEMHWGSGKSVVAGRNQKTYGRNAFYPSRHVRLVTVGNLRTWNIAVLEFWPYGYNPQTGQLRMVTSDDAQLSFVRRAKYGAAAADQTAATMSGFVSNGAEAADWYGVAAASSTLPGYAVVTTSTIAVESRELANFTASLRSHGLAVTVVTESDWGGGSGDIAADRIRAWLKANYLALGLKYVLLIGNPNPTSGDVPMKMMWPRRWSSSYRDAPSDYYYADLTGNWDRDGDGYAGEQPDDFGTGGIDQIPDVYVGRIPYYGKTAELDSVLKKTVLYRSTEHGSWARSCLMPMKPMDIATPSYQLGEQITTDFLAKLEAVPKRVYDSTYGLAIPPERHPCSYDAVLNEWAPGAGLVFWMTHGSYNAASAVFTSSRCTYLDDSKPAMVYMASCSNGQPEYAGCLGSSLLVNGGVVTLSASRVSWYYVGETDFRSSDSIGGLGYQFARFLTVGMEACGRAAVDARLANPMTIWPNHVVFNLYGDPSLVYDIRRSVVAAKCAADDAIVTIDYCLVSRIGEGPECYVQDANRCAGLRVTGAWDAALTLVPGSSVKVTGRITTESSMRVLRDAQVTLLSGQALPPSPIGMLNKDVGDAKNMGLLVTVWGNVLPTSEAGSVISDGSLRAGLKITCRGTALEPSGGRVRVTGIATSDGVVVYDGGDIVSLGN